MNAMSVLAWLQTLADLGIRAAAIAERYRAGTIDDTQFVREWGAMRIDLAQAEGAWQRAGAVRSD